MHGNSNRATLFLVNRLVGLLLLILSPHPSFHVIVVVDVVIVVVIVVVVAVV